MLSKRAPPEERGAIMGFNDAASNLALIVAPVLGGEAIDLSPHLVGVIPAAAAFLALAIGIAQRRNSPAGGRGDVESVAGS
jgi:MFS family permease